jgi:hypothetical protein
MRLESPGVLGPTMGVLAALMPGGEERPGGEGRPGGLSCPLLLEAAVLQATPQLARRPLIDHKIFLEEVAKVGRSLSRSGTNPEMEFLNCIF